MCGCCHPWRIQRIHYQELEDDIQCQSRGISDRVCSPSTVYINNITGGGVDIPEMETALLVLCLLI